MPKVPDSPALAQRAVALAYANLQEEEAKATARAWHPYPHQIPPEGRWNNWLLEGGRGAGKTRAGAEYSLRYLREEGPNARLYVGSPTRDDARDICAEGPSGLITIAKDEFEWHRSDRQAFHKNGGYVRFLGSEEPDRWNGPGFGLLWADELWAWNPQSWKEAQFCLREGAWPRAVITTTPKRSSLIKAIKQMEGTVTTYATTYDNPALPPERVSFFEQMFPPGSREHQMQMMALDPPDVEGALWKYDWIDHNRRRNAVREDMQRIVVVIDPAGSQKKAAAMTGIAVIGLGWDGHFYVFMCEGEHFSPYAWASRAVGLWADWQADKIVAEINYGGEMVRATLQTVWRDGLPGVTLYGEIPFDTVLASRGKAPRADPIASLYEAKRVHHVGFFGELENQMTSFPVENERDDMVDALVWGLTYLSDIPALNVIAYGRARGW